MFVIYVLLALLAFVALMIATAGWFASRKAHIDFVALNYLPQAAQRTTPTLLYHGTADSMVPVVSSDKLAQARPDVVIYERIDGAEHTQSWNTNHKSYEGALTSFLTRISEVEPSSVKR